jgi:CelD/BcsL family acetyltransferase involved in cellulose biosynthesis
MRLTCYRVRRTVYCVSFFPTAHCLCRYPMNITHFTTLAELAPLAAHWDRLARGVPFRSWAWLSAWWRHYGTASSDQQQKRRLYVLVVSNQAGIPVGIAPWYWDYTPAKGRVLRFLGLGEVCSDYLSVLCQPQMEVAVAEVLAVWLTEANRTPRSLSNGSGSLAWDCLELTGVDAEDVVVAHLADRLEAQGNTVHRRAGANCWRIRLPDRWDEYLAQLSKNHRKQLRRMTDRLLDTGRAVVHHVDRTADLDEGWEFLVDLHQRRRQSLGEPGCFASARFYAFHREVMPDLLHNGQLCMAWIEVDGRPAVAEYHLSGQGVVYAYQAGMEQSLASFSPGQLGNLVMIRRAIEHGYRAFDFLRGDEAYKAHWRAQPRPSREIRVVAPRASAQLRHSLWCAGSRVKRWLVEQLKTS